MKKWLIAYFWFGRSLLHDNEKDQQKKLFNYIYNEHHITRLKLTGRSTSYTLTIINDGHMTFYTNTKLNTQ